MSFLQAIKAGIESSAPVSPSKQLEGMELFYAWYEGSISFDSRPDAEAAVATAIQSAADNRNWPSQWEKTAYKIWDYNRNQGGGAVAFYQQMAEGFFYYLNEASKSDAKDAIPDGWESLYLLFVQMAGAKIRAAEEARKILPDLDNLNLDPVQDLTYLYIGLALAGLAVWMAAKD